MPMDDTHLNLRTIVWISHQETLVLRFEELLERDASFLVLWSVSSNVGDREVIGMWLRQCSPLFVKNE